MALPGPLSAGRRDGLPVMHSRSPKLHNYWFAQHGLLGAYVPLAIQPDGLFAALQACPPRLCRLQHHRAPQGRGDAAMATIDPVGDTHRRDQLRHRRPDGSLHGTNNDGFGYVASIRERFPDWRADAGPIVVLGAGGGSRAVVAALADAARGRSACSTARVTRRSHRGRLWPPVAVHDWASGATPLPTLRCS